MPLGRTVAGSVWRQSYSMARFEEPVRFLLAHNGRRLWAYFDALSGASDMKA